MSWKDTHPLDERVYYHGWVEVKAGSGDMSGWRYYPNRDTRADLFAIRIYLEDRSVDLYGGPDFMEIKNHEDLIIPHTASTPEEMQAWALAMWRIL